MLDEAPLEVRVRHSPSLGRRELCVVGVVAGQLRSVLQRLVHAGHDAITRLRISLELAQLKVFVGLRSARRAVLRLHLRLKISHSSASYTSTRMREPRRGFDVLPLQ